MNAKTSIFFTVLATSAFTCGWAQTNVSFDVGPGYNLITLPLQNADPTSSINSVLTNTTPIMPFGSYVSMWDPVDQEFLAAIYAGGDGHWYNGSFTSLATNSLPPGTSFFLFLPQIAIGGVSNLTISVTGSVLQGTNSIYENQGFGFYGNFEPVVGDITTNGFPITATGSYLNFWNPTDQQYGEAVYGIDAADNAPGPEQFVYSCFCGTPVVAPAIGQGFLYFNGGPAAFWTQTFALH